MEDIDNSHIPPKLREAQRIVAEKYKLGKCLVMGHKAKYFNEATEIYTKDITDELSKLKNTLQEVEYRLNTIIRDFNIRLFTNNPGEDYIKK